MSNYMDGGTQKMNSNFDDLYMRKETLKVIFDQMEKQMLKIDVKLDNLPSHLLRDFGEKYGIRIVRLEKEVEVLENKYEKLSGLTKYFMGAAAVLGTIGGILVEIIKETLGKHI